MQTLIIGGQRSTDIPQRLSPTNTYEPTEAVMLLGMDNDLDILEK